MKIKQLTGTMNPSKSRGADVAIPAIPKRHGAGASGETCGEAISPSIGVTPDSTSNMCESNVGVGTFGSRSESSEARTKGIQIAIDVHHLSDSARRLVPESIGKCDKDCSAELHGNCLPGPRSIVTVALNVPAYLAGDSPECGTSVYAEGLAALKIACAEMARLGVPREELDRLTTAHVSIQKAVVPNQFKFSNGLAATAFSMALTQRARAVGLNIIHVSVAPRTVEYRGQCALKKLGGTSPVRLTHEASLVKTSVPALKLVRLDLELDSDYLSGRGWNVLDSWRNAYAEGRYLMIFNENVRELFRLNTRYRIQTPNEALFERLSTSARSMLRDYLAGRDPNTCGRFPSGGKWSRANKKALKIISEEILTELGIDIMVPWEQFRDQPHPLLAHILGYPGDFQPPEKNVQSRFCRANWPRLLAALREAIEAAFAVAAQQQQANAVGGSRG